jgi:hypothetical protein
LSPSKGALVTPRVIDETVTAFYFLAVMLIFVALVSPVQGDVSKEKY